MKNPEFYIGWMAKAPQSFARFVKKYLLALLAAIVVLGSLLALSQKKFSTSAFEFGQLTTVKGIYFNNPVTCIKVVTEKDIWGNSSYITIPLVGYGKHGADGTIADIEQEKNISLNGKEITLRGTLMYNDGKTIMQIDKNDQPVVSIGQPAKPDLLPQPKDLGTFSIRGEIIDAKCYFGVMKPGEGKAHRDCAIRCILGGIPPMLSVQNEKGERNYYILLGQHGEKINKSVQPFVARPVELSAKAVQYDDWVVLYVNMEKDITKISVSGLFQPAAAVACVMPACP